MAKSFDAVAPTFLVEDVVRAAEYYRDRMGFDVSPYFGDPPVFTIVQRGAARFGLRACKGFGGGSNRKVVSDAIDAYIWVRGLQELHVYKLVRNGQIPVFKIGTDLRFDREAIDKWMSDLQVKT